MYELDCINDSKHSMAANTDENRRLRPTARKYANQTEVLNFKKVFTVLVTKSYSGGHGSATKGERFGVKGRRQLIGGCYLSYFHDCQQETDSPLLP